MSTVFSSGMPRVCICRISLRPSLFGTPNSISLSNLPGLLRAGSSALGMFVAPITITLPRDFNPSSSVSSCETTRFSTSPFTSSLFGAIESISSINTMLGAFFSACSNIFLKFSSLLWANSPPKPATKFSFGFTETSYTLPLYSTSFISRTLSQTISESMTFHASGYISFFGSIFVNSFFSISFPIVLESDHARSL